MIIKKISLVNIRSYTDETIVFPKGRVLLSGDIGSGKSSVLLCIEFALFGFVKGEISGFDLLRHGEKTGSVELTFEINKKEIIVKRIIKRLSSGIQQDAGYIIIDGVKTDLVAKELKARILKILGYSESMLNKSKSLIYRYTVYTPQEDMKKIILLNPQDRIDMLRTIFGIDKYKTIRENASIYNRELKRKINFSEGQIKDLDELKKSVDEKRAKKEETRKEINLQREKSEKAKKNLIEKKLVYENKRKDYDVLQSLINKLKLINQRIESLKNNRERNIQRIQIETRKIEEIEKELSLDKKVNEEKLLQYITLLEKKISEEKTKQNQLLKKNAEEDFKIRENKKVSESITKLKNCPTCLQIVDENHKSQICKKSESVIVDSENTLKQIRDEKKILDENILSYEKKLEEYKVLMRKNEISKLKAKMIDDKKIEITKMSKECEDDKISIEKLFSEKEKIESEIKMLENSKIEFEKANKEFLDTMNLEREESIKLARLETLEKSIDEMISMIEMQIKNKEILKKSISELKQKSNFFEDNFENMILLIEKHAMNTIYHEFNSLVSKWFSSLIGDDTITLKLDEEFTPTLEQNGYETEISNLSGGEKTAVALAYRLALNRIINEKISGINTKDFLILDEPTEGFSSEQLDRVSEVLNELNLEQIVIVSHESKAEGFVENIIRIEKNNHESKALI